MGHRLMAPAVIVAVAAGLAGACTHPGGGHPPGSTTTTTVPVTIPIDGWAIAGVTQNRTCGGVYIPDQPACRPPLPASDLVTVSQDGAAVAHATSAADGTFRIPVGPGTYSVQASTAAPSDCPAETVVISGPPVPKQVTLTCTIQVP
jgi:hypothetical protein